MSYALIQHGTALVCAFWYLVWINLEKNYVREGFCQPTFSTDSIDVHQAFSNMPEDEGGLGNSEMMIFADANQEVSKMFGVLKEDEGFAYNSVIILDENLKIRHITINDFLVESDVNEVLRTIRILQGKAEITEVDVESNINTLELGDKVSEEKVEKLNECIICKEGKWPNVWIENEIV